jgi:threonine dehydratase
VRGVVSATRGNHGQSLAFAGRAAGLPTTILVPHGNSPDKNAAMRGFGAELIEHGVDFQAAREHLAEVAAQRGLEVVPSFHKDLCMGVATYAHELFSAAGELDVVYVPVGMGSGMCGLMTIRDLLGLTTEIVGVVSDGAPATALSFEAGAPVSTDTVDTFIDGVATRVPDPVAIDLIVRGASRIVRISDDQCAEAVRLLLRCTHHLVEPSGAAALAGCIADRESHPDAAHAKRVGVIVSGGNIDAHILSEILAGRTPPP